MLCNRGGVGKEEVGRVSKLERDESFGSSNIREFALGATALLVFTWSFHELA